jgi:tRNA(Ile)-lysidine synthetase-like protein
MSSIANLENKIHSSMEFVEAASAKTTSRILVAYSGGPDSTALLWFIVNQLGDSMTVGAAHFDHRLRGENQSVMENRHVTENAAKVPIELFRGSAEPGEITAYAAAKKISVEEAARILRYEFLRSTAESQGFGLIATGHTADDLAETLIQRFFQGSGIGGLSGIPKMAGSLIRPILTWSRKDVEAYNASQALVPFGDPSNWEDNYLRNRIRHVLIPKVNEVFPGFRRSLATLAEKMELSKHYLVQNTATRALWEKEGDSYFIDIEYFRSLHAVERIESVRCLYDSEHGVGSGTMRLSFRAFSKLVSLPELHDNALLLRGWGFRLQVHGKRVFFEPDIVFRGEKGYFMVVKGRNGVRWPATLPDAGFCVQETTKAGDTALPIGGITFPLIVRTRREGDVINVGSFSKNLKKLYNEWNVPEQTRWKIPVCEDKTGIIAVLGSLFGFPDAISQNGVPTNQLAFFSFETS